MNQILFLQIFLQIIKPKTIAKEFSLLELITAGGPLGTAVMILLFLLLVLSFYIFFERFFTIKKSTIQNSDLIDNLRDYIHEGKITAALELCKRTPTPEARMLHKGLTRFGRQTREISDSIENAAQLEIYNLEKNVGILATIAGAAPMLGFLGTVLGLIIAFFASANAGEQANPQMLANGIYTAMANTAAGLIVGLLAQLFYNILVVKVDKSIHYLQASANDFLDIINKPVV